jgi:hypothetical protein
VGIGTLAPEYRLDVAGNIRATGEFVTSEMIVSKSNPDIGGTLTLINPAKTGAGTASAWKIFNMGGTYGNSLQFWAYDNTGCAGGLCTPRLVLMDNGNIGIGTSTPDELLTVSGTLHAKKVKIDLASPLADYVFSSEYKLMSLPEVESFVRENRHLPDMPSAAEAKENGIDMGEFQNLLLQKIEELTLHAIEQQKIIEKQGAEIEELKNKVK